MVVGRRGRKRDWSTNEGAGEPRADVDSVRDSGIETKTDTGGAIGSPKEKAGVRGGRE